MMCPIWRFLGFDARPSFSRLSSEPIFGARLTRHFVQHFIFPAPFVYLTPSQCRPLTAMSADQITQGVANTSLEASVAAATEQKVTPWDVEGATVDGQQVAIDYDKLVKEFGTRKIDEALLERFEKLTGWKPHRCCAVGASSRIEKLDKILDRYEQGKPFYLYTGRGPSSDSMHLGHLIPFLFTKWLQDVFDCPLVIQLTDDESSFSSPPSNRTG